MVKPFEFINWQRNYTGEDKQEYLAYRRFIREHPELDLPKPRNLGDYMEHKDEWAKEYAPGPTPPTPPGPTLPEPPEPPIPPGPEPPGPPEPEYSDEERREYNTYRQYASSYGDPDDWYPLSIKDYFSNWDTAQEQLGEWQGAQSEAEARREESYAYTDWSREKSKYAAEEAYRPEVQYGPEFYKWFEQQGTKSMPLQQWMEAMYPKLRSQFEATLPAPKGFASREEARSYASGVESQWGKWLAGKQPELEEEYWMQSPRRRGEAPGTFAGRIRTVAY